MRDYYAIGPTPAEEDCQQVGTAGYDPAKARIETSVFVNMLRRMFNPQHTEIKLYVERGHDAGPYYEAAVFYYTASKEAVQEMLKIDEGTPAKWDEAALAELKTRFQELEEYRNANAH